jgi:polysaccharide biosynthesis transport protein
MTPATTIKSAPTSLATNTVAIESTTYYLKALRLRFWMVLLIAVPLAILFFILVLRLPPVYLAKGEIEINPPLIDPQLSALMTHETGRHDPATTAAYVSNHEAWLRSKWLAQKVVNDPSITSGMAQYADPVFELFKSLSIIRLKGTNSFNISLEGTDPAQTQKLLEMLLVQFQNEARKENDEKLDTTAQYAKEAFKKVKENLGILDRSIHIALQKTNTIGPGGRSILEERFVNLGSFMAQKRMRLGELQQQLTISQILPKYGFDPDADGRASRIAEFTRLKRMYTRGLEDMKKHIRHFNADLSVKRMAGLLDDVLDELEELRSFRKERLSTPTEMILEQHNREMEADREEHEKLLVEMQKSIPEHQRILALFKDREERSKQIVRMEDRIMEFKILRQQLVNCARVRIPASIIEPTSPIKRNRALLLSLGLLTCLGFGVGLVCFIEHVDQSIKVPEQVSQSLVLPLLGVVPRIRRSAKTNRAGHLWTHATPDSIEADAYRNIRASLLGIADKRGPIVSLLVTSAKAGEGKNTTALNLAATCARAGGRTLLLDVDLRRTSLGDVFIDNESQTNASGLVDVLRGELAWQRTVRHTELPNLDFMPTGDVRSIPIEILGTLELRQLLIAVSHHYDRVILDGPAVLGLADCRVLGRIVDSALLVVRSGSNQLVTLHRAKTMLDQSHVAIAGVVFNGLMEDISNWSSYGHGALSFSGERPNSVAIEQESLALTV